MTRLIRYEYRRPGKPVQVYEEWLVLDRPDAKVLLQEYAGPDLEVAGHTMLERGAPAVWYVFPAKWHDVARFHLCDGSLTGFYTNLCMPVEIDDDRWVGRDLFLDLWQPVGGEARWLDEDELSAARRSGIVDAATAKRIRNERSLIDLQVAQAAWPPPIVRDVGLEQVRALKGQS
ncbi:MAG: DUF402 domain-containing protein [Gemmatimonadota bacterium]|nr:MAG: DUF402 domain-containing protein [Gemmatimonadota bacterium]